MLIISGLKGSKILEMHLRLKCKYNSSLSWNPLKWQPKILFLSIQL